MAFVAGVLLMFVPEEPAWQLLCQLMAEDAVGMRGLFVPGLAGLKRALRMFEWLLEKELPQLKRHLEVSRATTPADACTWARQAQSKLYQLLSTHLVHGTIEFHER